MKKHILLSIQPRIVNEIIDGSKTFEFRKKLPAFDESISHTVVIYCSSPVMKIIGSFQIGSYYHSDFETLMLNVQASQSYKQRISKYFKDKSSCHAMEITKLNLYEEALSLEYLRTNFSGFYPGQSYRYLPSDIANDIIHKNSAI